MATASMDVQYTLAAAVVAVILTVSGVRGTTVVTVKNREGAVIPCDLLPLSHDHQVTWTRDRNQPITEVSGLLEIYPNHSLALLPFEDNEYNRTIHDVTYRCQATNSTGTIVGRSTHVRAVLESVYERFNVRLNDVYVTKGNTAALRCDVNPYYVRDYVTIVSWTKNGKGIEPDERTFLMQSGQLQISDVTMEDGLHSYRCVALNAITKAIVTSDPASIVVIEGVNSGPSLVTEPLTIRVPEGGEAELPCVASGAPSPSYTWQHPVNPSDTQEDPRHTRLGGNMIISAVRVKDSGRYECTARNDMGTARITHQLIVTAPLSAQVDPVSQKVDVGHVASFQCLTSGNPIVQVTWLKDGLPLAKSTRISMTSSQLTISEVQRQDKGIFQCIVGNKEDNAQGAGALYIGASKPVFYSYFEGDIVRAGSDVIVHCGVTGNPLPQITWELDGAPLPLKDNIKVTSNFTLEGDVVSSVQMSNISVEDGGTFRCSATSDQGTASHAARLHVYGAPYIRPIPDVTVVAGSSMNLRCHVTGYPLPQVTWYLGSEALPSNHRQKVSPDGTLSVSDVTRSEDSAIYTCHARNEAGQSMRRNVKVHVIEPPVIDPFSFPDRKQGDRVSVTCVVSSGDLPLNITWYKDGRPITQESHIQVEWSGDYSSVLSIRSAEPSHNGNFTCSATNRASSATYSANFTVLVPPTWVAEPEDRDVVAGSDVTVDCLTRGTPTPSVSWMRATGEGRENYQPLELNGTADDVEGRVRVETNGTLVVHNIRQGDSGYYLCHSSNGVSTGLSKVVHLTVRVGARFLTRPHNVTVQVGDNATLRCDAAGDSPLSVSWNLNGKDLNHYDDDRMTLSMWDWEEGKNTSLVLSSVARGHAGFYVCNTKNVYGYDVTMVQLVIQDVPEAPSPVKVIQSESRSAVVSWSVPFDNNCPIQKYVVQLKNKSDSWEDSIRNMSVSGEDQTILVQHLRPAAQYSVRVIGVNNVGMGHPSPEAYLTTGEEAPMGAPTKVVVSAETPTQLVVKWQAPEEEKQNGEIKGYYIGYKAYNSSRPYMYISKAVESGFEPIQRLVQLKKFTMYSVHVQAYNAMGVGPRSHDVHVLTLEDVPSQCPRDVQGTALSSHSIMVVWSPPPLDTLHGILQGYKVFYKPVRNDEDENDAMFVTSHKLNAALYGLETYTNYSLEVLAYTRSGEGVRSHPLYVTTQPDLPEEPAGIKAVSAGPDSILVTWKPPKKCNGKIMKYSLVIKQKSDNQGYGMTQEVEAGKTSHLLTGLSKDKEYSIRLCASTEVGQGPFTQVVYAAPHPSSAAQIGSFSRKIFVSWNSNIQLPCQAVGIPAPRISWSFRNEDLIPDERIYILANGTLVIYGLHPVDAGNYTCRATNQFGKDQIHYEIVIQAPPRAPALSVAMTTKSSVQLNWRSGSNGGSKIQGFNLHWKKDHGEWRVAEMEDSFRSHTLSPLRCGTGYKFYLTAHNRIGEGDRSSVVLAATNGSAPIMPPQSMLIGQLNSTFVILDLASWLDGGCPIKSFDINYRIWGDTKWTTVESRISATRRMYKIDLHPYTWYQVRVTAHNEAGSTESLLKFITPPYNGVTVKPMRVVHTQSEGMHERAHVIIPLVAGIVLTIVLLVGVALFVKRRKDKTNNCTDQNTRNLRRDLTAETSLSEPDKRMSLLEREHSNALGGSNRCPKNTEAALNNDQGDLDVYSTLLNFSRSPADGSADQAQYAETPGEGAQEQQPHYDVCRNSDVYTTVIPSSSNISPKRYHRGVTLSASQYQKPERQNTSNIYSNITPTNQVPGNRLSTVSSQTTASSAQEELNMAFENARRRLARKPISTPYMRQDSDIYYSPYDSTTPYEPTPQIDTPYNNAETPYSNTETPYSNSSQPSNDSGSTDPGIRQFTQSPPDVANVSLPSYDQPSRMRPMRIDQGGQKNITHKDSPSPENTYGDVTSVYV